jgi:hypothetical protein
VGYLYANILAILTISSFVFLAAWAGLSNLAGAALHGVVIRVCRGR